MLCNGTSNHEPPFRLLDGTTRGFVDTKRRDRVGRVMSVKNVRSGRPRILTAEAKRRRAGMAIENKRPRWMPTPLELDDEDAGDQYDQYRDHDCNRRDV